MRLVPLPSTSILVAIVSQILCIGAFGFPTAKEWSESLKNREDVNFQENQSAEHYLEQAKKWRAKGITADISEELRCSFNSHAYYVIAAEMGNIEAQYYLGLLRQICGLVLSR